MSRCVRKSAAPIRNTSRPKAMNDSSRAFTLSWTRSGTMKKGSSALLPGRTLGTPGHTSELPRGWMCVPSDAIHPHS